MIIWGGNDTTAPQVGGRYNPTTDTWQLTTTLNAPRPRATLTSVWTGSEMIVWGGLSQETSEYQFTGGRYNPSTDSWSPTNTYGVPEARGNHSAVWTGTEMIIWGGVDFRQKNSGGRYNPATDSWQPTSLLNAPSARQNPEAVWTGTEMIIWGGSLPEMNSGGRYNPMTDSWRPTSLLNAPSARDQHRMVWTGSEMIVWGGVYAGSTGGRYNPETDTWQPTSLTNAPARRDSHTAVWTGTEMLIWGGYPNYDPAVSFGGRYNPTTNTWTAITSTGAPVPRHFHSAVWTGTEMVVWGGQNFDQCFDQPDGVCYYRDGGRYNPATDSWRPTTFTNAPPGARKQNRHLDGRGNDYLWADQSQFRQPLQSSDRRLADDEHGERPQGTQQPHGSLDGYERLFGERTFPPSPAVAIAPKRRSPRPASSRARPMAPSPLSISPSRLAACREWKIVKAPAPTPSSRPSRTASPPAARVSPAARAV